MSPLDAVFLDRDGTINVKAPEGSYICSPAQLRLLPHAGEAVRALNDAGIPVLVVTNQQGVASGRMTVADVHHVHQALEDRLRRFGAKLDGFYVCPHASGTCDCRKPAPGLFFQARREHPRIRFDHTVMIGDAETDVQAATAAGIPAIKLTNRADGSAACALYPDLVSAVRALIGSTPNDRTTTSSIKPL